MCFSYSVALVSSWWMISSFSFSNFVDCEQTSTCAFKLATSLHFSSRSCDFLSSAFWSNTASCFCFCSSAANRYSLSLLSASLRYSDSITLVRLISSAGGVPSFLAVCNKAGSLLSLTSIREASKPGYMIIESDLSSASKTTPIRSYWINMSNEPLGTGHLARETVFSITTFTPLYLQDVNSAAPRDQTLLLHHSSAHFRLWWSVRGQPALLSTHVFLKVNSAPGVSLDVEFQLQLFVEDTFIITMLHNLRLGLCLICMYGSLRLFQSTLQLKFAFLARWSVFTVSSTRYLIVSMFFRSATSMDNFEFNLYRTRHHWFKLWGVHAPRRLIAILF